MATSLLPPIAISDTLPRLSDATHAYWHVGHGVSRQLGQAGRDGLIPDKFDGIPRETHNSRSSVNFGGEDIFARKCMYEKLIKCAAKTAYEIQSYIPRTHEMKSR